MTAKKKLKDKLAALNLLEPFPLPLNEDNCYYGAAG
jgi:hypothetical protein